MSSYDEDKTAGCHDGCAVGHDSDCTNDEEMPAADDVRSDFVHLSSRNVHSCDESGRDCALECKGPVDPDRNVIELGKGRTRRYWTFGELGRATI